MAKTSLSEALPKLSPVTPLVTALESARLARRGCLVRVTSGEGSRCPRERWFAVGIYPHKMAERAVCDRPEIEPSDIVVARRSLKPAEIEELALQRRQILQCSVGDRSQLAPVVCCPPAIVVVPI
jgi:hypothetical protein